ncbi:hypothetical protein CRG98_006135 [Punica granatum]|uniref:Uncharacterized protein n=1 Tax=Punica granatum TaxID=22663 RepID=A0A2I0KYK9_PUNGR|nr:hypothetical protein CRG98_006135 [Punica granatum]
MTGEYKGRIIDAFDIGLALCREETTGEDKVGPLQKGLRSLMDLFLKNLSAGPEPVEALKPWFPRVTSIPRLAPCSILLLTFGSLRRGRGPCLYL